MAMEIVAGDHRQSGAVFDGEGTGFTLYSSSAEAVELCLFDDTGTGEIERLKLPERTHHIWHGYVPGLKPGAVYGYRVHGRYDPEAGLRSNPHKLLLDPYARMLRGRFLWDRSHFGFDMEHPERDLVMDRRDNASFLPKGVVCGGEERRAAKPGLQIPWFRTVLYETHVKGFTIRHPGIPEADRGTFAGMSHRTVVDYIKSLGITSVELMPAQAFIDEYHLYRKGLTNYWGYNTLSFFSPHAAYLASGDRAEFRAMVETFHDAGIEVILDVVYNHTCEGDHLGPTLSFRGIDNAAYYRLMPGEPRFYVNDSGCGNSINMDHPAVLRLVMDSLRYWAGEMGVDGFRFDLATILGRGKKGFSGNAVLFQTLAQDPVLSRCKLIAEPWDLGLGGYQLGGFPPGWSEWNDHYRDSVRRFWRGLPEELPELARRLHGSSDIFEHRDRRPWASVNYVTSHDGFTLRDLVSYAQRHNGANREGNRDGHRGNHSFNCGVEGETSDPAIDRLRWQHQRNFLATLMVSQGVPMIAAGDEFGRSQRGNNNAYCQDNPLSWIDWEQVSGEGQHLTGFIRKLLELRASFPVLRADRYRHLPDTLEGESIQWLDARGDPMNEAQWHDGENRALGYLLTQEPGTRERYLLVLFNGAGEARTFTLPEYAEGDWRLVIDTADTGDTVQQVPAPAKQELLPHSMRILVFETTL